MHPIHTVALTTCKNIAYTEAGKGKKTLLFIHGLASFSQCWEKNIDFLQKHFRCIAIDLPGNGFSAYENYSYTISFFSACIKEFIEALELKNVSLVGHSLGGQIAIHYAAHYPQDVQHLILCAPAGFETFTAFEKNIYQSSFHFFNFFSSDANSLAKSITTSFYHYTDEADELIENAKKILSHYPAAGFRNMIEKCIEGMLDEPVFHLLHKLIQPTLVFFGERDVFIPNRLIHPCTTKQIAEAGMSELKNAKLIMLPKCGHYVQWEKYREVNEEIKNFLT